MPFQPASRALSRFTVLDLTRVRAGPTAVRQLADWGANVIKIEMPAALDTEDGPGGPRHGSDFQNLHRNKRGHDAQPEVRRGQAVLNRLVRKADVLVENYRPDVKHRLGIDYETLKKINPRLVYASISGFGQDGPYRERPGFDQIAQGMGGLMSITGAAGPGPDAGRHPDRRSRRRALLLASASWSRCWSARRPARANGCRPRCCRRRSRMLDFQAARWLVEKEVAAAGRQQPPDLDPDRRVRDRRRLHQHRGDRADDLGAVLPHRRSRPT